MDDTIIRLIPFLVGGFFLALISTFALVRKGGIAQDIPNERSSHIVPTPRGGGVAFCAAFFSLLATFFFWKPEYLITDSMILTSMWLMIAILGFFEDRYGVPAKIRFLVQFVAATVLVCSNFFWSIYGLFGAGVNLPNFFAMPISVLFIVWVTNLYNFMDGINGIASLQGMVLSTLFFILGTVSGNLLLTSISGILFAVLLGFLLFNFPRAKIFMGDSGSLFLGFVFATLPFMTQDTTRVSLEFIAIAISPFLADTFITLILRISRGENLAQAHRSHFYQKFQILTGSHTIATLTYTGFGILFLLVSLSRLYRSAGFYSFALVGSLIALLGFFLWVHRQFEQNSSRI
jgi:Fuc2NAc and GlcNAc transferase